MNIVYIHTHDTGRYIQPYGYAVPTPALQAFAENGSLFRNAFSAAPTCSPSRSALLLGMWPHSTGMIGLAHRGFTIADYSKHLVQYLNSLQYETFLCGEQHEAAHTETIGYHKIIDSDNPKKANRQLDNSHSPLNIQERDIVNADRVATFLRKRKSNSPFFLSFGMVGTHREFPDYDSINPNYVRPPFPVPDNEATRKDMAAFIQAVTVADRCVQIVMDALADTNLLDETIVIFTTDHGIAFPNMKCSLYDTGIGVSLIMNGPGLAKGQVVDQLVSHIDIYPTLCDLLEIPKPNWLQGTSLLSILQGKKEPVRKEIFAEVTYHAAYEPIRSIRTKRYKLIRYFDQHTRYVPANIDDSLSKSFLLENDFLKQFRPQEMLFDLYLDPVERINLVNNCQYSQVYSDLASRLEKWMETTSDPLLTGKIPKPPGAVVNKLSCISPEEQDYE